eukprot:CAMPEP_0194125390 /NCGR_PEP_ID=MMETSP0150-20130528/59438_1 /TAXON_ID=122233 /ORGANISM="Chaetoceros debilis, Strain MM31A-1" /LENGTH=171 /DNA_ID=CAMNT_0038819197 /DNA_START=54 /DNA_END=566 /DNA_ORIENTATION=+
MTNHEFHQCLEPFFHMSVLIFSLVIATFMLIRDLFNPSPTATAWCGVSVYPYWRLQDDSISAVNVFRWLILLFCILCITTIVVSMIMIVAKVRKRDQQGIDRASATNHEGHEDEEEEGRRNAIDNRIFQNTKIIRNQAIAYSIVNLFGFAIMVVLPYTRNFLGYGIPTAGW